MPQHLPFRLSLSFIALWLALGCGAQTFTLRGRIADGTNDPVPGASVLLVNTTRAVNTDANGTYSFSGLKAGTYTARFTFIGFFPQEKQVELSADQVLDITLVETAVDLKEVSVSPRSDATLSQTIGSIDRDLRPVQTAQDLLKMVPGLFIAQHAGGGKADRKSVV